MAIVAQFRELDWFFDTYKVLDRARAYMKNALDSTHSIHKRIINLSLPNGEARYEVSHDLGQGIRAIEQVYALKDRSEALFETHRAYIDFQLVVQGYECAYMGDYKHYKIKTPYDEKSDLIMYENALPQDEAALDSDFVSDVEFAFFKDEVISRVINIKSDNIDMLESSKEAKLIPPRSKIILQTGHLAVFFPNDVHALGLKAENSANSAYVKKSVLKVPVELLQS